MPNVCAYMDFHVVFMAVLWLRSARICVVCRYSVLLPHKFVYFVLCDVRSMCDVVWTQSVPVASDPLCGRRCVVCWSAHFTCGSTLHSIECAVWWWFYGLPLFYLSKLSSQIMLHGFSDQFRAQAHAATDAVDRMRLALSWSVELIITGNKYTTTPGRMAVLTFSANERRNLTRCGCKRMNLDAAARFRGKLVIKTKV